MNIDLANAIAGVRAKSLDREYSLIERSCSTSDTSLILVDLGCSSIGLLGRCGERLEKFRANAVGIDIDRESLKRNVSIRRAVCGNCYALPLRSSSVDILVCRWVFEHLEFPARALTEFRRVLKPGGIVYIKTPNLMNYAMLLARVTPTWFHNLFRVRAGMGENIPTFYRANTKRRLMMLARDHGFVMTAFECYPYSFMYFSFNKTLFRFMKAVSGGVGVLSNQVQLMILCVFKKTE